jgi:hypothetical protein
MDLGEAGHWDTGTLGQSWRWRWFLVLIAAGARGQLVGVFLLKWSLACVQGWDW